ncbi:hypothetical protein HDZ31DRAFT_59889 [Schizophyllum fasciatum]
MARPALPTSSSDFALPAAAISPDLLHHRDEPLARTRRQSILASHLSSPLAESFTLRAPQPRAQDAGADSDRDRMSTDTPPSSGSEHPPPPPPPAAPGRARRRSPPLTPPRRRTSDTSEPQKLRRLSHPLRPPRLLNLLSEAEARPEESEARGEAVFQRLVASGTELAAFPSPRNSHDRGRFPEEAPSEDGDESDDDSDEEDNASMAASAPIPIGKPRTPAGSVCGDDPAMRVSESPSAGSLMDVDVPSISPSVSSMSVASTPAQQWRSTPPPTQSAVRSNKRKHDDRYDPYPSAKRRAVSPSIVRAGSPSSFMRGYVAARGVSPHLHSPRATPRMPLAIPKSIPGSSCSSAASSPTVGGMLSGSVLFSPGSLNPPSSQPSGTGAAGNNASSSSSSSSGMNSLAGSPSAYSGSGLSFVRPAGMTASPTLRASMGLASPILRPVVRSWLKEGEEPEVEGAGEKVNGLTLGER